METSQVKGQFILPTLQAVLIKEWNDVLNALGDGDYRLAWERTQTFFEDVVPPDVETDCKKDYENLKRKVQATNNEDIDYVSMAESHNNFIEILETELRPFMNKVKHRLFFYKWLTKDAVSPRIKGEGHF